jgi:hypothetical protein
MAITPERVREIFKGLEKGDDLADAVPERTRCEPESSITTARGRGTVWSTCRKAGNVVAQR